MVVENLKLRDFLACSVAMGALATSVPAFAQEARDGTSVAEVVVTATKRAERLQDVPSSITAETGVTLTHRGATRLEDVIENTPGITNPGTGGNNNTNLTIRGVTTSTTVGLKQSTVALLFDDVPLDPAPSESATALRLVDIERVEVLRGPQGTLFGSGSLSGAVRYITNKPDLNTYSGSGEVTAAATENGKPSYWGNLVANIPLIQDKLAMRIVGYGFHEGGWVDDLRTGEKDENLSKTYGGRIAILARPTENFSVNFLAAYQDGTDYGDENGGASLYTKSSDTDVDGQVSTGGYVGSFGVKSTIVNLGLEYDWEKVSLQSSSTYINRKFAAKAVDTYFVPLTTLIASYLGEGSGPIDGLADDLFFNNQNIYTQEVRLSSRNSNKFKWTLGGFYLYSDGQGGQYASSDLVTPVVGGSDIVDLTFSQTQEEISGFGEATYTLASRLDLTAGVRVSKTKVTADTLTGGFVPVYSVSPDAFDSSHILQDETAVDPRFSITFRMDPNLTLYAQASRGYRVGGPNLTAGVGGRAIPDQYHSDSLWNYEVGSKGRMFDGRLTFSGALYYIDWSNIQVGLIDGLGNYTGNAGEAGLYGLELQVDSKPVSWLEAGASLALSHDAITHGDPTISRPSTGLVGVSSGDRLPASPEVQASGYLQYDLKMMDHDAYLRLGARYIGPEYTDFDKLGTKFGDYAAADLRAGVNFDRFEVVGFVDNLFDSQGKNSAVDESLAATVVINPQIAYRIRPRTIGVTLRAKF